MSVRRPRTRRLRRYDVGYGDGLDAAMDLPAPRVRALIAILLRSLRGSGPDDAEEGLGYVDGLTDMLIARREAPPIGAPLNLGEGGPR